MDTYADDVACNGPCTLEHAVSTDMAALCSGGGGGGRDKSDCHFTRKTLDMTGNLV
jgi:hypothetical protein